ncbi:MAG: trypsin-like peptidase domain-containing protein [Nitrospirae bacterium]|nr:trypsin-like peptidase domain-containing protein [Nitrospirota bacterium]
MKTALEADKEAVPPRDPAMRFALTHLSGSRRGETREFEVERLTLGTDPVNDLAFDPARDPAVSPRHAELSVENCELILRDRGSQTGVYVNHQCVTEIILQDNDLVTVGQGGPQLRVRVRPEAYASCKPFKDILCDCRDIATAAQRGWAVGVALFFRHLLSDLAFHASRPVRVVAGAVVLIPVVLIVGLLYAQYAARQHYESEVSGLLSQLETGRISHAGLEQQVQEERRRMTGVLQEQKKERETLATLLARKQAEQATQVEVTRLKQRLRAVEAELAASEQIISRFRGGVAFLQGSFGFVKKGTGQPLRYQGMDADGDPLRDAQGHPLFTLEDKFPPVTVNFTGTAFLVDARGFLLTNRHLARPWEMDQSAGELIQTGFEPRLLALRVFFPDQRAPFELSVVSVAEQVDVALVKCDCVSLPLPVLPMATRAGPVTVGEPILLLGYPTGFDALLARTDPATSSEVLARVGNDWRRLAQEISDRRLIRPVVTQGHLGDVLAAQLIYDAQTTFGGSGGPVFNLRGEVIAINHMILRRFGGVNFGVPIQFGVELLRKELGTGWPRS